MPDRQVNAERVEDLKQRLVSEMNGPAVVALEGKFWDDAAATAAIVGTLQEFRDLFSSEVLAPGLQVGIERLAILFTDLSGSTAMYEQLGQARAFRFVQDHFRVIERAVRGIRERSSRRSAMQSWPSSPL